MDHTTIIYFKIPSNRRPYIATIHTPWVFARVCGSLPYINSMIRSTHTLHTIFLIELEGSMELCGVHLAIITAWFCNPLLKNLVLKFV